MNAKILYGATSTLTAILLTLGMLSFVVADEQDPLPLAPKHPEWKTQQPFRAVLDNDMKALGASGEKGLLELIMATHAGMTTTEFEQIVLDWIGSAIHPRFKRPYTNLVFKPMLELLDYLRQRLQDFHRLRGRY